MFLPQIVNVSITYGDFIDFIIKFINMKSLQYLC